MILRRIAIGDLTLVISDQIEAEYRAIATRASVVRLFERRRVRGQKYLDILDDLCDIAERATPAGEAPPCRDEDDRKYLHCAQSAAVDYLVTRDRDLLDLEANESTLIVTPDELLERLRSERKELGE